LLFAPTQTIKPVREQLGHIPLNSSGQGKIGKFRWRTARNATRLFEMHRSTVYLRFRKAATAIGLRLADQEKRKERAGVAKHGAFAFLLVPFPFRSFVPDINFITAIILTFCAATYATKRLIYLFGSAVQQPTEL
jgi:hypothetical protein